MRIVPLNDGKSITLVAGGGQVEISPGGIDRWRVKTAAVTVSTNTSEPVARLYVDTVSPTAFIAGTYTGSNDSTDLDLMLMQGQKMICVWSGGDTGATATLSVWGEKIYAV